MLLQRRRNGRRAAAAVASSMAIPVATVTQRHILYRTSKRRRSKVASITEKGSLMTTRERVCTVHVTVT